MNKQYGYMTPPQRRHCIRYAIFFAIFTIVGLTCTNHSILTLVAIKLEASNIYIGALIFALQIPWLLNLASMSATERYGKIKIMFVFRSLVALSAIPFLILPLLASQGWLTEGRWLLFGAVVLMSSCFGFSDSCWLPLLQDMIPKRFIGRYIAIEQSTWQAVVVVLLFAIASLFAGGSAWWKFELLFAVATFSFVGMAFCTTRLKERPFVPKHNSPSIPSRIKQAFTNPNIRRLGFYLCAFWLANMVAEPFKVKYMSELKYSPGFILFATSMSAIGAVMSLKTWGRLSDKFGNPPIIKLCLTGLVIFSLLWLFVTDSAFSRYLVVFAYFGTALMFNGVNIAQIRYLFHLVDPENQQHLTIINNCSRVGVSIAPLLGGFLLEWFSFLADRTFSHYHLLFVIAGSLFLIPLVLSFRLPLETNTRSVEVILHLTRPLFKFFGVDALEKDSNQKPEKQKADVI